MSQKIIQGSREIADQIRRRRQELGLTIEEAASRAGVGTKTWCRYEAGESIRKEKCRGICRSLNWRAFPNQEEENVTGSFDGYREHGAWSEYLEKNYGISAAMSFAAGSEIFRDHIEDDMKALASMPRGTHLGQLSVSMLSYMLPDQFLMDYDYDFLYRLKCALQEMAGRAGTGESMTAYSVLQEMVIYLCVREAAALMELWPGRESSGNTEGTADEDWMFDLFGDADLISFLYSGLYLQPDHPYHFSRWDDFQFYMPSDEPKSSLASLFD